MTELVLHGSRSGEVVDLARRHVADGSISELDTPALLRRAAREQLGADVELRLVVSVALPVLPLPKGAFVLVEHEVRPGLTHDHLARVPRNCAWRIRLAAFERALRRAWRALARGVAGSLPTGPLLATSVHLPVERIGMSGPGARGSAATCLTIRPIFLPEVEIQRRPPEEGGRP